MDMTVDEFNARYPVGSAMRYYPIRGEAGNIETKTRSEAWALGHGEVVVKIEGRTGGCCISHMEAL